MQWLVDNEQIVGHKKSWFYFLCTELANECVDLQFEIKPRKGLKNKFKQKLKRVQHGNQLHALIKH